jgi:hypothetical protein
MIKSVEVFRPEHQLVLESALEGKVSESRRSTGMCTFSTVPYSPNHRVSAILPLSGPLLKSAVHAKPATEGGFLQSTKLYLKR